MAEHEWSKRIIKWFREGKDRSEELIGLPWNLEVEEGDEGVDILARHPSVPFMVATKVTAHFAKLGIITDIETDFLEPVERLKIYKTILVMNGESNLLKIGITGIESLISLFVDLDLASLNREEFNDALSALIMGTYAVYNGLGLQDKLNEENFQRIASIAYTKLEEGKTPDDVKKFLSETVGLESSQAIELVESLMKVRKEKDKAEAESTLNYIV